jgi:hypothetical protein
MTSEMKMGFSHKQPMIGLLPPCLITTSLTTDNNRNNNLKMDEGFVVQYCRLLLRMGLVLRVLQ